MEKFKKGILGGFSGKVGNVVGARWKGHDVMRSLPSKSSRPATEKQIKQRVKFMTARLFVSAIAPVATHYFGSSSPYMTKLNQCMSYNLREAVVDLGEEFIIDYSRALVSKGDLLGLQGAVLIAEANQQVKLSWMDNSTQGNAKGTDYVILALYDALTNATILSMHDANRSALELQVSVGANNAGAEMHAWALFVSTTGVHYSTSNYLGVVTIV